MDNPSPQINVIHIHQVSVSEKERVFPIWDKIAAKGDHFFTFYSPEDVEEELMLIYGPEVIEKYRRLNKIVRRNVATCAVVYANGGLAVNREAPAEYKNLISKCPLRLSDDEAITFLHAPERDETCRSLMDKWLS